MIPEITLSHLHYFTVNFIPMIIIIVYLFSKLLKIPDELFLIIPFIFIAFTGLTLGYYLMGISEKTFFQFDWRYEIAFSYIVYFWVNWFLFYSRTNSFKISSVMTVLTTLGIGWLYEVPRYLTTLEWYRAFWHSTFPFFFSSRMIGMVVFFMILGDLNWKPSRKTTVGIILFTAFSIAWMIKLAYIPGLPRTPFRLFMYRIPAMILMLTFPIDIKGEKRK